MGWTLYWIGFNGNQPHQWMRDEIFILEGNLAIIRDPELFHHQFVRLLLTVAKAPAANTCLLSCQAAGLLSHFLRHADPHRDASFHHEDERVSRAVEFIWNHSHAYVDVPEVVAHVGCGRRALERRFAAGLGRSVLDEIQRCRVSRAKRLLEETSLPIKQIVYRAGLRSRHQLWRPCRKHLGMAPDAYRHRA